MTDLYLSRLILDPRSRQVQSEINNYYQMHRTIMKAFVEKREKAGVLFRLESQRRKNDLVLLVQSTAAPDWDKLKERSYLQAPDPFYWLPNPVVKELDLDLKENQILNFRLRANPTIKKKREGQASNRVPLVREENQGSWLQRKAQQSGFRIIRYNISEQSKRIGWKRNDHDSKKLTIYEVQFDGLLQVTDPPAFQLALRQGIGPAKAFGCGLLSLAPG